MSDFNSPLDRDLMIAERMGAQAVKLELSQPGVLAGSQRIRADFRKAVLSRYLPENCKDGAMSTGYLRSLRTNLNRAYYAQPAMIAEINRKPEVKAVEIDGHAELVSA